MITQQNSKKKSENNQLKRIDEIFNKKTLCIKKEDKDMDEVGPKRKRKALKPFETNGEIKVELDGDQKTLPQKKRALLSSPSKKQEEPDDEALIRETEAALKSLSGSWPGSREEKIQDDNPGFENLFEEKKKFGGECPLKDVITLRAGGEGGRKITSPKPQPVQVKKEEPASPTPREQPVSQTQQGNDLENLLKIENECATLQSQVKRSKDRYGPDFNELVEEEGGRNGLDMDMEKEEKKKNSEDDKKYLGSAFRPVEGSKELPGLGPFPAAATFVGYPGRVVKQEPKERPSESPEKQYTILQPAGTRHTNSPSPNNFSPKGRFQ